MMARIAGMAAASRSIALKPLAALISAGFLLSVPAHAVDFGHSRLLSASGQPLRVDVPIRNLSADDLRQLQVSPAPEEAWKRTGLTPPVPLLSLQVELLPGTDDSNRVARLQSSQPFNGQIADILIDVVTAAGRLQHQVSLLAQPHGTPLQPPAAGASAQSGGASASPAGATVPGASSIHVRKGDTLFSLARRHAVPGVSVWQMMAALYNVNPQAFIKGNMNLVKAGATLAVPDASALTALSNAEARALFREHDQAFRSGKRIEASSAEASAVAADDASAKSGTVGRDAPAATEAASGEPRDQLKLSAASNGVNGAVGAASGAAGRTDDDRLATRRNVEESGERIAQLEDNVRNLNQALQAQGHAAQDAVAEGVKAVGQTLSEVVDAVAGSGETEGSAASSGNGGGNVAAAAGTAAGNGSAAANGAASADGAASGNGSASGNGASAGSGTVIVPGSAAQALEQAQTQAQAGAGDARGANGAETGSWFGRHLLGILTGLLALLVLIVAWLLRRANAKADEREAAGSGQITESMIQEKLENIDLDLQDSGKPESDRQA